MADEKGLRMLRVNRAAYSAIEVAVSETFHGQVVLPKWEDLEIAPKIGCVMTDASLAYIKEG